MEMAISMEKEMTIIPVAAKDKQDSVVIPQILMVTHTDRHMAIKSMDCTLVVYDETLTLVTKGLPLYRTLNMSATLEWNDKEERLYWPIQNLK